MGLEEGLWLAPPLLTACTIWGGGTTIGSTSARSAIAATTCGLVRVEIIASSKTAHSVVCRGRQAGRVTVTALIVAHCG